MPNWCSNYIEMRCDDVVKLDQALNAILNEAGEIDFEKMIAMPALLNALSSGRNVIDGVEVNTWIREGCIDRVLTSLETAEIESIGYLWSDDWAVVNWGTKWNASQTQIDLSEKEWGMVEITYDTPWCPPFPVLMKMRKMFPDVEFEFRCRFEDDHAFPHIITERSAAGRAHALNVALFAPTPNEGAEAH